MSFVYTMAVVGVVARLGLAELVPLDGSTYASVADLAHEVKASEEHLYRLMRCAANMGVFKEAPSGRAFAMTPAAALLRVSIVSTISYATETLTVSTWFHMQWLYMLPGNKGLLSYRNSYSTHACLYSHHARLAGSPI